MAIPTLDGIELTGCENIRQEEATNIVPLPMPTEDSGETELFDMLGVIRLLSINGRIGTATVAATKALVDPIVALANGNQTTIVFDSDQTGELDVMVSSISINWDVPGFSCTYDIKLLRGKDA